MKPYIDIVYKAWFSPKNPQYYLIEIQGIKDSFRAQDGFGTFNKFTPRL